MACGVAPRQSQCLCPVCVRQFDSQYRPTFWYTTQFGAGLAITSAMFAIYFWTRRTEIESPTMNNELAQAVAFE